MFQNQVLTTASSSNPMNDKEVSSPPDDSVSALAFSPATSAHTLLVAGGWDNSVRCWQVEWTGKTVPVSMQTTPGPVLDVCWSPDGTKVFVASCDATVKYWDLVSNQTVQVAAHEAPVKTCHFVQGENYSCLMTGSWDKTLKFWDTRSPNPMLTLQLPERCYCADVDFPLAVVGTGDRKLVVYKLDGTPREKERVESPLKYQHRCVAVFKDKNKVKTGYAVGSVGGKVAIQYLSGTNPKHSNFSFKCHRSAKTNESYQDVYPVNDLAVHPVHGTLATVGSDGKFSFWDMDARSSLKHSSAMDQAITNCAFNADGQVFAYAVGYDWAKGHEFNSPTKKTTIFLRSCYEELKPHTKQ